jgi:hypothetical protein
MVRLTCVAHSMADMDRCPTQRLDVFLLPLSSPPQNESALRPYEHLDTYVPKRTAPMRFELMTFRFGLRKHDYEINSLTR